MFSSETYPQLDRRAGDNCHCHLPPILIEKCKKIFNPCSWKITWMGVTTIDADYVRPGFTSSHLLVEKGHAAFIDTGTTRSVPLLLKVLEEKGISCEKVTHVMGTHIHLDHAGGAGVLMQQFPNAVLVVHPRDARHMIYPIKLIAGTV